MGTTEFNAAAVLGDAAPRPPMASLRDIIFFQAPDMELPADSILSLNCRRFQS
ncbi:hypothetical protein [Methanobrevibacter sp.]|uniref:hypothetical protein n=1 Tax=Methanobrevibacter sp. TaxID=66852 RepID=UPI00386E3869